MAEKIMLWKRGKVREKWSKEAVKEWTENGFSIALCFFFIFYFRKNGLRKTEIQKRKNRKGWEYLVFSSRNPNAHFFYALLKQI